MTTFSKQTPSHLQNAEEEEQEEGQWKNLPTDVLSLLLRRFHTKPDLCRFRSICKSWRCFATPIQPRLLFPLILPPLPPGSRSFCLSPEFLYIFSPNSTLLPHLNNTHNYWLTKLVELQKSNNKWLVLNPLTNRKLYPQLPRVCKNGLNLLGFRNHELGRSYRVGFVWGDHDDEYTTVGELISSSTLKKVVILTNNTVSVLGLNKEGHIVLWNYGNQNWNIIDTRKENGKGDFDDIICYDGKFYAVDRAGRLVMINPNDMEVVEVINSRKEGYNVRSSYSYKESSSSRIGHYEIQSSYLVESEFRLYRVAKTISIPVYIDDQVEEEVREELVVDFRKNCVGRPYKFRVYVLNEMEMSWEKVYNLGNKVFFFSDDTVFSANAADLGLNTGNCIYFNGGGDYEDNVGVYTLEDEAIVNCDSLVDHQKRFFSLSMTWFGRMKKFPECEMQD